MNNNTIRKTNQAGVEIIKRYEGLGDGDPRTANLDPYLCPANVVTIGWGHAVVVNGRQLTGAKGMLKAKELYPAGITLAEAEALLLADLVRFERAVQMYVARPVTDNQFAALVSLCFNIGETAFRKSTLLRLLNRGKYDLAAQQFDLWVNANSQVLKGLVLRRKAERELFST